MLDLLDHWQTLIAAVLALAAALLALRAARLKERREVEAMRKSLAVEIPRLVDILRQAHRAFIATAQKGVSLKVSYVEKQTSRWVPDVYSRRVGLLGDVAPHVITFYASLRDIEFAGRRWIDAGLVPADLRDLANLIDTACRDAQPLLSRLAHTLRWWRRWWWRLVG